MSYMIDYIHEHSSTRYVSEQALYMKTPSSDSRLYI